MTDTATDETTEPPVEPDELREGIVARFTQELGDAVVDSHIRPRSEVWIRVTADAWREAGRLARYSEHCRFFDFISAIDWMPSPFGRSMDSEVDNIVKGRDEKAAAPMTSGYAGGDTRFQVLARVANVQDHWAVTFKADLDDDAPTVDSWTPIYAGADWHEREAWEMFGITFTGHPGLRRLYLPTDFEGTPLRKDFPLVARMVKPWPGIVDVEQLPGSGDDADADAPAEGDGEAS